MSRFSVDITCDLVGESIKRNGDQVPGCIGEWRIQFYVPAGSTDSVPIYIFGIQARNDPPDICARAPVLITHERPFTAGSGFLPQGHAEAVRIDPFEIPEGNRPVIRLSPRCAVGKSRRRINHAWLVS